MADIPDIMGHAGGLAQPIHIQRLHKSLVLQPFLNSVEKIFKHTQSDDSDSDVDVNVRTDEKKGEKLVNGIPMTKEERRSDKMRLFNFTNAQSDRKWLCDVLISDSSDSSDDGEDKPISEEYFQEMLKQHVQEKKYRQRVHNKPEYHQYQYYGTGLLSNYDKYPEHRKSVIGFKKVDNSRAKKKLEKSFLENQKGRKPKKLLKNESSFNEGVDPEENDNEDRLCMLDDYDEDQDKLKSAPPHGKGSRGKRKADKVKSPEVMALRRRKLWAMMSKKELAKAQRSKVNNHKEVITMCKKVAQLCIKHWKQKALQSQKNMKETVWRNKRLTREMQAYWKRYERVERDTKRRQEKEAEEQRKMDVELMEAKRQQRKLNFLITQTELYAHFISKKLSGTHFNDQQKILSQLEEEKNPRLASIDDYDSEEMKLRATKNVEEAFNAEKARSSQFEHSTPIKKEAGEEFNNERPQPLMFKGNLKHYQLKGMNWLSNLYDQGINGILADEMGLGKTVQSIAFLCHIAEKYSVWGPFLIISPASTLHNWQQEMKRFVPDFKVVPYWGSVQERRIMRQFWDQKDLHTKEASFHVVITSYQLVISDFKYFNRIKWQYLILDEAQAIKSSNSMRWKLLLGFSCRNRLLLSGTPIQNSMAELWALLHFIMPTLFDNHEEFSEWFSKDIESQAENKSKIDEKHLSRLHLILKPFMLRRIKKDVENELSDKIEIMVYCPLTIRQKLLYSGLKKKIRIEDLLAGIGGRGGTTDDSGNKNVTSSLMNLVMQFRKVCNHPELFERREAKSPFYLNCGEYVIPKLVYEDGILNTAIPSFDHLIYNKLSILAVEWMHRSLFPSSDIDGMSTTSDSFFSFLRFVGFSTKELQDVIMKGILYFWLYVFRTRKSEELIYHRSLWGGNQPSQRKLLITPESSTSFPAIASSPVLNEIVFTSYVGKKSKTYTHSKHIYHSMAETLQHRVLRSQKLKMNQPDIKLEPETDHEPVSNVPDNKGSKKSKSPMKSPIKEPVIAEEASKCFIVPEFPFVKRPPVIFDCEPTPMPEFLYLPNLKIQAKSKVQYSSCRNSAWDWTKHLLCTNFEGWETVWFGHPVLAEHYRSRNLCFNHVPVGGLLAAEPNCGWSNITIPDKQTMVADAGKLYVLDNLLKRLKEGGHRVLIYSQMTRMIDLLEEYMWHRKHTYMRLDGSSKISERRDMVADFQSRADIFVFLLSTRAGGLGINLTAADTVIFYDSDWNPTVDQQAMDRAHRLGQTKQVTVYRLICKGTIEERILQRAREKSEIQRMVISGGNFKPDHLKPKEVVSLLLDDEEIEKKYHQKQAEKKLAEENKQDLQKTDKRRKLKGEISSNQSEIPNKKIKLEPLDDSVLSVDSTPQSPTRSDYSMGSGAVPQDDTSNDALVVDVDSPAASFNTNFGLSNNPYNPLGIGSLRVRPVTRGSRRGRPRGLRRGASNSLTKRYTDGIKLPGEMFISGESPSVDPISLSKRGRTPSSSLTPGIKRGPGRPRMRPFMPGSRGTRGPSRARKAPAPLQVPISRTSASSSPARSSGAETPRPYGFYTPGSSGPE